MSNEGHVVALSGGIGGAKLASGLAEILPPEQLTIVANTGDDFEHLGLHISPDIDTLLYTLAGINNPDSGWGRAEETWSFMSALEELGADTWFKLGDKDLAVNIYRTHRLRSGQSLSEVTVDIADRLGIPARVLPMSDQPVHTVVKTDCGLLELQEYFVRRRGEPVVSDIQFRGADSAVPSPLLEQVFDSLPLAAVVICPSNPFLSIDPILSIADIREWLANCTAPVIAVSPIIHGNALKGPTAKIMKELGLPVTASTVAQHYHGLIDGFVIDTADASLADSICSAELTVTVTNTVMDTQADRIALARDVMAFAARIP